MVRTFQDLPLTPGMLEGIARAGYTTPTPIQAQAIVPILEGRDVIGCAQTGTGKTAAFAIPTIERLLKQGRSGPRVLVLAPTRELALQIAETFDTLGGAQGIRSAVLIGGEAMGPQLTALGRRPDVIVATPGRLFDHLERRTANLGTIRLVVLDEADRMLDMGFAPQVDRILRVVPLDRQTLCFSATMPKEVERLVREHLVRPVRIDAGTVARPVAGVTQVLYRAQTQDKTPLLLKLLGQERGQTLVFTRTKHRADRVARAVQAAGHRVTRLHADRSMSQRREALDGFRNGRYRVLIATDIAARGIDVPEITHVVNFDMPHTAEDYIHRIGRTARAEASGRASSLAAPEEHEQLRAIERHLGHPVPRHDAVQPAGR
ncbi:MAG: DEAD/DEAH box helicase [Candidatus Rokubacteria bacterium]|nr:DEAD/DEAH box helicase [Candidatus Rokubacteria bacterium]MBI2015098.1 DEAD/DEAH box helicase [Candidatus Rokubacteria bacterium]MBI4629110.1 DEAD/DEAH box helicase [Candidatus Rokubacteria bacterium]